MNAQDRAMNDVIEKVVPLTNRFQCELEEVKRANGLLTGRVAYLEGQNETIAELLRGLCNGYADLAITRRDHTALLGRIQKRITA